VIPQAPIIRFNPAQPPLICPRCGTHGWRDDCQRCLLVLGERIETQPTRPAQPHRAHEASIAAYRAKDASPFAAVNGPSGSRSKGVIQSLGTGGGAAETSAQAVPEVGARRPQSRLARPASGAHHVGRIGGRH
jgi:hypothetical protein